MNHPLFFFLLATLLTCLGFACLHWQRYFQRWRTDRELDRLAGGFWFSAIISAGMGVVYWIFLP